MLPTLEPGLLKYLTQFPEKGLNRSICAKEMLLQINRFSMRWVMLLSITPTTFFFAGLIGSVLAKEGQGSGVSDFFSGALKVMLVQ